MEKLKIILVDDSKTFRKGFKFILENQYNLELFCEAENGSMFLNNCPYRKADLIFMDIEMPQLNGFETTRKILEVDSKTKIIALTMYDEKIYLEALVSAGFKGYLHKESMLDYLDKAIVSVMSDKLFFDYK